MSYLDMSSLLSLEASKPLYMYMLLVLFMSGVHVVNDSNVNIWVLVGVICDLYAV